MNAMRSDDGNGPTGRVVSAWVSDGSLASVSPAGRALADLIEIAPWEPTGSPGETWSAMRVGRGALDTRPAQGRVGVASRHASHLETALLLLAARASEPSDAARPRPALPAARRPLRSRRPAPLTVASTRRIPTVPARPAPDGMSRGKGVRAA